MRVLLISLLSTFVVFCLSGLLLGAKSKVFADPKVPTPVLVELFISEGCSSCPPADRLLEKLDQQPVAGADLIVLSEHVDYWNHIGWKDPYSSHSYSERQSAYGKRFGLDSVYTPQMVVDGTIQFVGSNSGLVNKALGKAVKTAKIPVRLSSLSATANTLRAHLETGNLDPSYGAQGAEVYVAIALNHAQSQVSSGENAGHKLEHAAVVKGITRIGAIKQGQRLSQEVQWKIEAGADSSNLRLIAFVQEPLQGHVLGAAAARVTVK